MNRLQVELPNLRAALAQAATAASPDHGGLRLVASPAFFWSQRGYALEGADHAKRVLAADPTGPPTLRARAGWAGAYDRFHAFDFDNSTSEATAALADAEAAGAQGTQGRRLHVLAGNAVLVDPDASRPLFTSALALARLAGGWWCEADSMQFIGWGHLIQHRPVAVGSWPADSGAGRCRGQRVPAGMASDRHGQHRDRGRTARRCCARGPLRDRPGPPGR